jgi:hypothetical protein
MTDKSKKLTELAALCEAATASDREMDAMIHFVIKDGIGVGYASDAPAFTASLDAALTLSDNFLRGLSLHQRPNPDMGGRDWIASAGSYRAAARSWPLAVCAAALRARAVQ